MHGPSAYAYSLRIRSTRKSKIRYLKQDPAFSVGSGNSVKKEIENEKEERRKYFDLVSERK